MSKNKINKSTKHYDAPIYGGWSVEDFSNLAKRYSEEWNIPFEDITFEIEYGHGYYDSIEIELMIRGSRFETDEEEQERINKEKEKKIRDAENARKSAAKAEREKEDNDKKEWIRLKEKYGND